MWIKGFTQIPGVDFDETFSPVARFELLRMLLVLAVLEDWHPSDGCQVCISQQRAQQGDFHGATTRFCHHWL
jgi:hypothetical protein